MAKYGRSYPKRVPIVNNADEMIVEEFGEKGEWGTLVQLKRADGEGQPFEAEYLTPEEKANKRHPYNVAVSNAFAKANELQAEWKKDAMKKGTSLDINRVAAWVDAFELKDGTVSSSMLAASTSLRPGRARSW
jgi:hypothetical protein